MRMLHPYIDLTKLYMTIGFLAYTVDIPYLIDY